MVIRIINGTFSCPHCKHKTKIAVDADKELQIIQYHCQQCNNDLELSVWVREQKFAEIRPKQENS